MLKLKNAIAKYRAVPVATGLVAVAMPITAYAENQYTDAYMAIDHH